MTLNGWLQITFFLLAIFLVARPLGSFMAKVFARDRTWPDPVLRPIERLVYRATGVDETHEPVEVDGLDQPVEGVVVVAIAAHTSGHG